MTVIAPAPSKVRLYSCVNAAPKVSVPELLCTSTSSVRTTDPPIELSPDTLTTTPPAVNPEPARRNDSGNVMLPEIDNIAPLATVVPAPAVEMPSAFVLATLSVPAVTVVSPV